MFLSASPASNRPTCSLITLPMYSFSSCENRRASAAPDPAGGEELGGVWKVGRGAGVTGDDRALMLDFGVRAGEGAGVGDLDLGFVC